MSEENATKESELHPDDLFYVGELAVNCLGCQVYARRVGKTAKGTYTAYVYVCPSTGCSDSITLKVPRTAQFQRGIPTGANFKETELEPDDSFSIAQLDVVCSHNHEGKSCLRNTKESEGESTLYIFGCPECSTEIQVKIPRN